MSGYSTNQQTSPDGSQREGDSPHSFVTVIPVEYPRPKYTNGAYPPAQNFSSHLHERDSSEMSSLASGSSSHSSQQVNRTSPPVTLTSLSGTPQTASMLTSTAAPEKLLTPRIPNGECEFCYSIIHSVVWEMINLSSL